MTTLNNVAIIAGSVAVVSVAIVAFRGAKKVGDAVESLNPANPDNVVNKTATEIVNTIAGDEDLTIGERVFRLVKPDEAAGLCRAGKTKFCTADEIDASRKAGLVARGKFFTDGLDEFIVDDARVHPGSLNF